jgi:hypothetical protein
MVFDRYGRQAPTKPAAASEAVKPASGGTSSSYLSRLAGQVGTGGSSGVRSNLPQGGNSHIWAGSPSTNNVRSSIEKRLHWVETAFKKGDERQQGADARSVVSSVRNRINALLTYDLPPKVRSELELIDRELNKAL